MLIGSGLLLYRQKEKLRTAIARAQGTLGDKTNFIILTVNAPNLLTEEEKRKRRPFAAGRLSRFLMSMSIS